MSNYEATRYDFNGADLQNIQGVNTGIIVPWTDASIPSGFLECNGTAVSRSTYAALFAIIGTTYGSGDGSTTFNIPDLQDDTPIGKSPTKALASTGGANTVSSTGNIGGSLANTTLSTPTIANHSHPSYQATFGAGGAGGIAFQNVANNPTPQYDVSNVGGGGSHSHNLSANFTGDATSVLQPYLTLIYIIKT